MRKVFEVELGAQNGHYTELTLPAAPYALLDALEKLEMKEGDALRWDILRALDVNGAPTKPSFGFVGRGGARERTQFSPQAETKLSGLCDDENALCQQLALLDEGQLAIVEGLAKIEYDKNVRPIPLSRLIDMAYSTDRCHHVEEATDNYTLGRFCAENGFVPEADDLSDEAFELLDFAKIGREFRQNEGGVFTSRGYVQKHDELRQMYETLYLTAKKPDYTILVQTASGCEVRLPVPLGAPTGDEPVLCVDCAVPALAGFTGTLGTWDMLARRLAELEVDGELPKYKALLEATGCDDICRALSLADRLEQYSFDPKVLDHEGMAKSTLSLLLTKTEMELLLPHVNLFQYGQALVEADCGALTGYGLIERNDGEPIHGMEQESAPSEMEMTQ